MPRSAVSSLVQMRPDLFTEIGTHRPRLLRYARRRLGDPAHAEDAVQEAMVAALEGIHAYAGESALGTWLTGILKHKIVDSVRRTAKESFDPLEEHALPDDARGPDREVHGIGFLRRLDRCLEELPARAAQVFMLRDVLGMSTREACGALDISSSNCAVLLHRARRRLRERLASDRAGIGA